MPDASGSFAAMAEKTPSGSIDQPHLNESRSSDPTRSVIMHHPRRSLGSHTAQGYSRDTDIRR